MTDQTTCKIRTCEELTTGALCEGCLARMRAQESPRYTDTVMDTRGPRGW